MDRLKLIVDKCNLPKKILKMDKFFYFCSQLLEMFTFEGLPESVDVNLLMLYKILTGWYGVFLYRDIPYVGYVTRGEGLTPNGYPRKFNIFTLSDVNKLNLTDGIDCVIGFNNHTRTCEFFTLLEFSELLSECVISEKSALLNSRLHYFAECSDTKTQQELKSLLKNVYNGKDFFSVVSRKNNGNMWKELNDSNSNGAITIHRLFDNQNVNTLQQLTTYYNEVIKRFFFTYSLPMSNGNKQAQQTVEEVNSNVNASFTYATELLNEMEIFIDKLNKFLNINASVKFSNTWQNVLENMEEAAEDNESEVEYNA